MPIYEFRCENGHLFEVMQRISDPPITECETCGAPVTRVYHPIAVHFKGSGFYSTDYGRGSRKPSKDGSDDSGSGAKKDSDSKTESNTDSKTESKTEA